MLHIESECLHWSSLILGLRHFLLFSILWSAFSVKMQLRQMEWLLPLEWETEKEGVLCCCSFYSSLFSKFSCSLYLRVFPPRVHACVINLYSLVVQSLSSQKHFFPKVRWKGVERNMWIPVLINVSFKMSCFFLLIAI